MKRANKILLGGLILATIFLLATTPNILSQILSINQQPLLQVQLTSPSLISKSQYLGSAPTNKVIEVMIIPQFSSALAQYIENLYNPSSPDYHKFLTPYQIYSEYTPQITQEIASYASQFGIKVVPNTQLFPELIGTVGQFEKMFHVQFGMYKYGNMNYFAPTQDVELPESIAPYVAGVLGLNNITMIKPAIDFSNVTPLYLAEYKIINGVPHIVNQTEIKVKKNQFFGAFPYQIYTPLQLESAYNLLPIYKLGFYGQGETIAIVDAFGNPDLNKSSNATLVWFDQYFAHLPNPPNFTVIYYPTNETPENCGSGWGLETALDVEYAHTMAPGANILLVYAHSASFSDMFGAVAYVVQNKLANVMSLSWGAPECCYILAGINLYSLDEIFETAVAEGIQVFAASGDWGVYNSLLGFHSILYPASSPYVTAVGGTSLFMKGVNPSVFYMNATMQYLEQTGWGDYFASVYTDGYGPFPVDFAYAGSGGGESQVFSQPFYQSGLPYSYRTNPDIAMDADPYTGVDVVYFPGFIFIGVGGTSLATPLSAGIAAIVEQYYHNTLGFLNPYLYRLYFMSDKIPYNYAFLPTYASKPTNISGVFLYIWYIGATITGAEVYTILGNDTGYFATPGQYNFVTGLGSINAYELLTLIDTNGTALDLSGNGYATSTSAVPMDGNLTVSFWLNPTEYPGSVGKEYIGIVGDAGGSTLIPKQGSWAIFLASNGSIQLEIAYHGISKLNSRVAIPLDKLTLVTVTYDNVTGQAYIYFNGTLVGSATLPKVPLYSYPVYIGNVLSGLFDNGLLYGEMANLQIYDQALPQPYVQDLYLANVYGAPIAGMGIVSWALMEQTSGATIYSQIGPDYTLSGTYSWSLVSGFVPAPQYLGIISFTYNIYSPPVLI